MVLEKDYLDEDPIMNSQIYYCASFCTIGDTQKKEIVQELSKKHMYSYDKINSIITDFMNIENPKRALKVRGSFRTMKEAEKRSEMLRMNDPDFHIFVGEVGKWCHFNPDPNCIEKEDYTEEGLNNLVKGYKVEKMKSKQHFEQRKRDMMEKAMQEGTPEGQEMLMKEKEPIQVVENRLENTMQAIDEYKEKIADAERLYKLYSEKLTMMKQQEADGEKFPTMDEITDTIKKRDLPDLSTIDLEKEVAEIETLDSDTKEDLEAIRSIEANRDYDKIR